MKLKHSLNVILLGLITTLSAFNHAEIEMLDRVVAIVDNKTVTQSELDGRLQEVVNRSRAADVQLPSMSVIKDQVLDQLISETLQLNMAGRYGVEASDEEILASIETLKQERNMTDAQLERGLAAEGVTMNEFKESMRRQLTLQTITQGIVNTRVRISEQDIDNFLQSADAKFWISPEYRLQHILIPVSGSDTSAVTVAQTKAESIVKQLRDGADFTAMAIAESKGPAALKGGDLGYRKTSALPTLFADAAPSLEINQVSEPLRSRAGFHILKLLDKKGETKQVVRQSNVRHILISPNEILDKEEAKEKILDLRQQILDGEDFAKLAKDHTDDIGSKMSGGDLGWSRPGLFVAEFEQTMENLDINQISDPIHTQFGWHIIQVTERRDEDLSQDVIRQRAQRFLIGRRFEDEVQLWLQEMRDEAYIETKI